MNEAAKMLRVSRRYFQDWLRDHPLDSNGRPFFASLDRRKTFDEDDLRGGARGRPPAVKSPALPGRRATKVANRAGQTQRSDQVLVAVRELLAKPRR